MGGREGEWEGEREWEGGLGCVWVGVGMCAGSPEELGEV